MTKSTVRVIQEVVGNLDMGTVSQIARAVPAEGVPSAQMVVETAQQRVAYHDAEMDYIADQLSES